MPKVTKSCKRKRAIHVTSCRSVSADPGESGSSDRVESIQDRMDWEQSVVLNAKLQVQPRVCLVPNPRVKFQTVPRKVKRLNSQNVKPPNIDNLRSIKMKRQNRKLPKLSPSQPLITQFLCPVNLPPLPSSSKPNKYPSLMVYPPDGRDISLTREDTSPSPEEWTNFRNLV